MSYTSKVIAFCGTRGLPANYGGFETAVDEISKRFVAHGYQCDVFCRESGSISQISCHENRNLVYVKGSKSRTLDTFVSAIRTGLYLRKHRDRYQHVFWFNNANFLGIMMTRCASMPMSVNTDGLEWRRAKWSWPFKLYYIISSFIIARCCKTLIADSLSIQDYYKKTFWKQTCMIPYGTPTPVDVPPHQSSQILERLGLERGRYFLQITRFEPDNLPLETATAFQQSNLSGKGFSMVVVGFKDATPYALRLKHLDGRLGVRVLDAIYDQTTLQVLRQNCFCYVHGNSVGGTNPALLEAMSCTPRIMAIDCCFSHEVLGDTGIFFDPANITPTFLSAIQLVDQRDKLSRRVRSLYQWDEVAAAYMRLADNLPAHYSPELTRVGDRLPEHESSFER